MTLRRGELAAILSLAAAIVTASWVAALAVTDPLLPHERQMVELLEDLGESGADARVVVLGTSLDRNALGTSAELSAYLSTPDRTVAAVNFGISAAGWETFAPVLDEVWAAAPDVLVLQPDVFRPEVRDDDRSLRARIERWFDPPDVPALDERRCAAQTEVRFENQLEANLLRHTTTVPYLDEADALLREATDRGVMVVFYVPPRSPRLVAALDGADVAWRAPLLDVIASHPDVIGPRPPAEVLGSELYCDWTHLDDDGGAQLLEELRPVLVDALARADAE